MRAIYKTKITAELDEIIKDAESTGKILSRIEMNTDEYGRYLKEYDTPKGKYKGVEITMGRNG